MWVSFWAAAALMPIAAYMISSQSVIGGEGQARYLYGLPLAIGALIAVVQRRRLALVAATALALGTAVNFLTDPPQREPREHGRVLAKIVAAAREAGVTRGYASYLSAYPIERASRFALQVSPVGTCLDGVGLCPMYLHRLDGAFAGRPGRTFLLVDRSGLAIPGDPNYATEPPADVPAEASVPIGDGLTMYVYDHDLAADLGPLPPL